MPWKDDSKTEPKAGAELGPWDAPGAAVAPPPKPKHARRPWDDDGHQTVEPVPKRPRLPRLKRPHPAERIPARKSEGRPANAPRLRRAPKIQAPAPARFNPDAVRRRLARAVTDRFAGAHGRRLRVAVGAGALLGLACGWAVSGLYRVAPDQLAVVERFGAFGAEVGPGLHYHLPWPIGRVRFMPVGATPQADGGAAASAEIDATTPMLAADGAPVEVSYSLSWRVTDPRRYLFRIADAPELLKPLAEGAVRRAVGTAPLKSLLTGDRTSVAAAATADLQRALDQLGAGVRVGSLDLRGVDPADAAEAGAREFAAALQDARAAQAEAAAYQDRVTAQARGDQAKALQEAKGVADQEIAEAKGEADRFTALDAAYAKAPEATRERLYTETMERVLKATNKVVVDAPKGSTVVLPASVVPQHGTDASPAQPANTSASMPPAGDATPGAAP